jgi:uncharacterized protein YpiB (UPF0302 family)
MEEEIKKEEPREEKKEEGKVPEKPLDKMTATELRDFALSKNIGISGVHAMKKEELLVAIKEALGIKDEAPVKKKSLQGESGIKELKQKIRLLKEERNAAVSAHDKKKTHVLRRRINRLKKRTKKIAQA